MPFIPSKMKRFWMLENKVLTGAFLKSERNCIVYTRFLLLRYLRQLNIESACSMHWDANVLKGGIQAENTMGRTESHV
jgi:hypothetical protein